MKNSVLNKSVRDEIAERGTGDNDLQAGHRPGGIEAKMVEPNAAKATSSARWRRFTAKTTFVYLGVVVADDTIYRLNGLGRQAGILGPLAGATAEVTDGTSRHTLSRVIAVVGSALSKKTSAAAFVVTAGGELARHKLDGVIPVRQAQAQSIKFNALVRRAALNHPSGS
jgi:hypothetical protein